MEHNEEPELGLLLTPVDPPDGEEGQGEPEGGDEVHQPLPHHAPPKLGRAEEGVAGHQHQVDQEESNENHHVGFYLCCDSINALAEIILEFMSKLRGF